MMKNLVSSLLIIGLTCSAFTAVAKEPTNLADVKKSLALYHDSGEYNKDVSQVINKAMAYLKTAKVETGKKPAIVLDIDETSLSNYDNIVKLDFGGTIDEIRQDEDKGVDSPIPATLKLYQFAKAHDIHVIFLTGRFEEERAITEENLKKAGYTSWDKLILRTPEYRKVHPSLYKTAMRKQLVKEGYDILLNIGDQKSDLAGGYADKTFKVPNPYYFIA